MTADIVRDDDTRSTGPAAVRDGPTNLDAPVRFDDRVLAEAVRLLESDGTDPIHDESAETLALRAGGDLEQRIVCRARLLDTSGGLLDAIRRVARIAATVVLLVMLLALFSGAAAGRAALGTSGTSAINVVLVLVGLLGVQTLLLVAWLAVVVLRPSVLAGGSLGGLVLAAGQRLAGWLDKGRRQATAIRAIGGVFAHSALGKWNLSAISHAIWLSFNVGAMVVVVMLLSARDYTFVWETTILSEDAYRSITRVIGAAPQRLGFLVPTDEQVRITRYAGDDGMLPGLELARTASRAWAGLLVGSLLLYAMLPRTVLLVVCLYLARRAARRYRLELTHPGYRRLRDRLLPPAESLGVVDPEVPGSTTGRRLVDAQAPPARPLGAPAVVGYEITPPRPWPPPLADVRWIDLGFVDDRQAATRVVDTLRGLDREPSTVLVVCELTTTPDRGVQRFLEEVSTSGRQPAALLLTGGQRLRERVGAEDVAVRVDDWRGLARASGLADERVLELDLEHATSASLDRLERLMRNGATDAAAAPRPATGRAAARHVEEAFGLIAKHAAGWRATPDRSDQIKLQVAIARLHRDGAGRWRELLQLPDDLPVRDVAAMTGQIRRSAERMVQILPPQLRSSPRWLAAGAVTGALGCLTAAMLISPVAISALPIWSGLGAGVAAAMQLGRSIQGAPEGAAGGAPPVDLDGAIRSAALFAVLLELQGRDEVAISSILAATFADEADAALRTVGDARAWLDERRHRLDLAMAEGGSP